jgi:hypothetical protein
MRRALGRRDVSSGPGPDREEGTRVLALAAGAHAMSRATTRFRISSSDSPCFWSSAA